MGVVDKEGRLSGFGNVYRSIAAVELPFLKFVRDLSQEKHVQTLEIGGGLSLVLWKLPFAFSEEHGGQHHFNELSREMVGKFTGALLDQRFSSKSDLRKNISIVPGDCFRVLSDLFGIIDAVYVQNLEHYFSPKQHQEFMDLIEKLLVPGGKAFLCSNAPTNNKKFLKFWNQRKQEKDLYPGFASYTVEMEQLNGYNSMFLEGTEVITSGLSRPKDDAKFQKETLSVERGVRQVYAEQLGRDVSVDRVTQRITDNRFSPEVYKGIVEMRPNLIYLEGFFIDSMGRRLEDSEGASWAAAIIQKDFMVSRWEL